MPVLLTELIKNIGGQVSASTDNLALERIAPLDRACAGELSFVSSPQYLPVLANTHASVVIIKPEDAEQAQRLQSALVLWLHPNPYWAYAKASQYFAHMLDTKQTEQNTVGYYVHPSAILGQGVVLGAGVQIGAGCVIGDHVQIGAGSLLHARVTIYSGCQIGERCIVHSGAVIGADGFGFAHHAGRWEKIIQNGQVIIGDDVEIGANTTIDRGALDDTIIGSGVKLDNQIQIAHNVVIGDHTAIAGCVGIAGSTRIGQRCTLGGAAMVFGHLDIADDVHISGATVVSKSIRQPGRYTGYFPLDAHQAWEHNAATVRQLAELRRRVRQLEKQIVKSDEQKTEGEA